MEQKSDQVIKLDVEQRNKDVNLVKESANLLPDRLTVSTKIEYQN